MLPLFFFIFLLLEEPSSASSASPASFGPAFLKEPPSEVLYANDTGVVLDCVAKGEPSPTIDWVDDKGNILPLMPAIAR